MWVETICRVIAGAEPCLVIKLLKEKDRDFKGTICGYFSFFKPGCDSSYYLTRGLDNLTKCREKLSLGAGACLLYLDLFFVFS